AVLPVYANRMTTLLEEPGFSDYQHAVGIAQLFGGVLGQVVPCRVGIPRRTVEQVVQAVRRGMFCRLRQLPAVLAFDRAEQPKQIVPGMPLSINATKVAADSRKQTLQIFLPTLAQFNIPLCN